MGVGKGCVLDDGVGGGIGVPNDEDMTDGTIVLSACDVEETVLWCWIGSLFCFCNKNCWIGCGTICL